MISKHLLAVVTLFALTLGGIGAPPPAGGVAPGGGQPVPGAAQPAAPKTTKGKKHKKKVNKKALRHALHKLSAARKKIARSHGQPAQSRSEAERAVLHAMHHVRAMLSHKK